MRGCENDFDHPDKLRKQNSELKSNPGDFLVQVLDRPETAEVLLDQLLARAPCWRKT